MEKYHNLALGNYNDSAEVCFIAGYCFDLHGYYITEDQDEKLGLQLIERCLEITINEDLKSIVRNFLRNSNIKKYKNFQKIKGAEELCSNLFPDSSLIESYFRDMYL